MLNKDNRLTKRKEFAYVYRNGERTMAKNINLICVPSKLKKPRFGFSISKKVGKAHQRNLLKRRLSEVVRKLVPEIKPKFNYIFVAKPGACDLDYSQISSTVYYLLTNANKLELGYKAENQENA